MRKVILFLLLLILTLEVSFVSADFEEGDKDYSKDTLSDNDYANEQAYQDGKIFQNPKFDPTKVPANHIKDIPPDKVGDPNKVKDQSKLTVDQLKHGDNYNKVADKSKLSKEARDHFLTDKTDKNIKTELPPGAAGEAGDEYFWFDNVGSLQMDNNVLSGGTNVVYQDGILTADHVDSFVNSGSVSTNVDNLEIHPTIFEVKKADSVISGCVELKDVEDSTFQIYSNAMKVNTSENTKFSITDCDSNDMTFDSMTNESEIIISKDSPAKYKITKGILKSNHSGIVEAVIGNNTVTIDMGLLGIRCMTITPVGTYWYNEELIKDFGVNVPVEQTDEYKLCLRKLPGEIFDNPEGIIDFVDDEIELKEIVNYLRYPFEQKKLISPISEIVYEGHDQNNKVTFTFDDDFIYIDELFLENDIESEDIGIVRSGYLA